MRLDIYIPSFVQLRAKWLAIEEITKCIGIEDVSLREVSWSFVELYINLLQGV